MDSPADVKGLNENQARQLCAELRDFLVREVSRTGGHLASNLGAVELPEVMAPYVRRVDFIIGVQAAAPHDCGVVSWNGTMYINCIRSIQEPELELHFYRVLQRLGLPVKVESNRRGRG